MLEIPITKQTTKMLSFIRKHPNSTFETIQKKFKKIDFMDLVNLSLTGYLVCTRKNNIHTNFSDGNFKVDTLDRFWASPKTDQYLEERFQRRWQWIVPTVISGMALILSVIAFIVSLSPTVTEVRIVP